MPEMLTAKPVSVQFMASETPLDMVRASAEPSAAIESNTASIPDTVPTRPSRGHSGTITLSMGMLATMPALRRLIMARRI